MLSSGHSPNTHTFPSLLRACAHPPTSRALHAHLLKSGLPINNNPFIHSSLVAAYAKTHLLLDAQKLFDFGSNPNPVSATALIVGYADSGQPDMARELFDSMPVRDAVAWNAMISAYARCGRSEDAFKLFDEMLSSDAQPTESTMASVLSACARAGEIETGEWVRRWIEDRGFGANVRLLNGLVDMYAKCGDLEAARVLFDGLRRPRGVVSWNIMIGGYARLERFEDSLALFRRMQIVGEAEPNEVTLLGVIPACANLGALDVGRWIHAYVERMNVDSNALIRTSLIDMYAKCGSIESAKQIVKKG
ncbi:Pentatricopeptide repeat-containing protein [Acorus gramineus]|uniref:Pentatricopeptide repeat-containing protein n=1 Tax=Acorus gramineus TaxID=55184 RepID=A0AAV9A4A5_ACOGR|nr:Pentatricopeptide repeat-containing protein [Acorus gramineus]